MTSMQRQTSFDRGVARELVLVLTASDNNASYRCDATNEAKKTISASTALKVFCKWICRGMTPGSTFPGTRCH